MRLAAALLATGAAGLAGWLTLSGPRPTALRAHRSAEEQSGRVSRPVGVGLLTYGTVLGAAITLRVLVAASPAALLAATGTAASTVLLLTWRHVRAAAVVRRREQVARAAASLAVQLTAGLVTTEALRNAAADWPVLRPAATVLRLGGDPSQVWAEESRRPGQRGLAELARGWRLCRRSGAPLAPTLERIAAGLAAEQALGLTVTSELSAPRATGRIMAVLPVVGLLIGYGMGGDPLHFLLDTAAGQASLVAGAVLAAAGVWWIEWISGRIAGRT